MDRRVVVAGCALAAGMWALGSNSPLARPLSGRVQEASAPELVSTTSLVLGEFPPTAFSLVSIDEQIYELATMRGERPLLLIFFRGAW